MINANMPPAPDSPGATPSPVSRRPLFARRRRVFILIALLTVVVIGVLANYGPVHAYLDARSRLERAASKVAALEEQKAELQSQLGKLTEAEYVESLAREELTYARPGEDVYIITGLTADGSAATGSESAATGAESSEAGAAESATGAADNGTSDGAEAATSGSDSPGPLERLLSTLIGIF